MNTRQFHSFFNQCKNLIEIVTYSFIGQIISKGLFVILEFSQKMNERIRRSIKNEFVRSFFGRIRGYQKSFWNYLTFSFWFWCTLKLRNFQIGFFYLGSLCLLSCAIALSVLAFFLFFFLFFMFFSLLWASSLRQETKNVLTASFASSSPSPSEK